MRRNLVAVALLAVAAAAALAQPGGRQVSGRVSDSQGTPLEDVEVCSRPFSCDWTDAQGRFELESFREVIRFSKPGYQSQTHFEGDPAVTQPPTHFDIRLEPSDQLARRLQQCHPRNEWGQYVGTTSRYGYPGTWSGVRGCVTSTSPPWLLDMV